MTMEFLSQVNAGSAVPFERSLDPARLGSLLRSNTEDMKRISRYQEQWKFYLGEHWAFEREDGDPLVTLNYARVVVNKSAVWLVGAGQTINVAKALQEHTLPRLLEVWKNNNQNLLLLEMAIMGGVTGDVFVLVTYEEPTAQTRRINPQATGKVRIQLLSSDQVFPTWDPFHKDVLKSVRIETLFYDNDVDPSNPATEVKVRRFTQEITATEIIERYQGAAETRRPNLLGEISLVHIKNQVAPGEFYGLSDLDSVVDLNRELNEKATDTSDTIHYHAAPLTVVIGAKVGDVDRSAKSIWSGLPLGATVSNLAAGGDLGAAMSYLKFIKTSLFEIAEIPEGAIGAMQAISNTSGEALGTQLQPLIEKTARKRVTYVPGLQQINYFILRTLELTDPSFVLRTDMCSKCGGRIVEFTAPNGRTYKKCYQINPQTFEFLTPEEVQVSFLRKYSFGERIESAPFAQVEAEHGKVAASYWDPAVKQAEAAFKRQQDRTKAKAEKVESRVESTDTENEAENKAGESDGEKPETIDIAAFEIPPEPEQVTLLQRQIDTSTGDYVEADVTESLMLVPTGCTTPQYLNPYETEVTLNDTLPKDRQFLADLYSVYLREGLVTHAWVRRKLPDIDDPEGVERELKVERSKEYAADREINGSVSVDPRSNK